VDTPRAAGRGSAASVTGESVAERELDLRRGAGGQNGCAKDLPDRRQEDLNQQARPRVAGIDGQKLQRGCAVHRVRRRVQDCGRRILRCGPLNHLSSCRVGCARSVGPASAPRGGRRARVSTRCDISEYQGVRLVRSPAQATPRSKLTVPASLVVFRAGFGD